VGNEKVRQAYEKYCAEWLRKFLDGKVGDWKNTAWTSSGNIWSNCAERALNGRITR
jgi:hypothetical protein